MMSVFLKEVKGNFSALKIFIFNLGITPIFTSFSSSQWL